MIDYHSTLVAALSTVLPTHYEMTVTRNTKTPCITYLELNNSVEVSCNVLGYSRIAYQVKVWGHEIEELQGYALMIDAVLRPLGFKRTAANEMYDRNSTMIQKVLTYETLVSEKF